MAALGIPAPRKLPVWSTVGACYATVARNLGQLVRISWLWLLIMIPVYAAVHWLVREHLTRDDTVSLILIVAVPPSLVVELPFLASIAVAWHRLVLRRERVTRPVYLRLNRTVWLYALYSFLFLLLVLAPWHLALPLILAGTVALDEAMVLFGLPFLALALCVVPRLSLVLPATAVGERLSLRQAWRCTRGNTLRLALATSLCMLPAVLLFVLLPMLLSLAAQRWIPGVDIEIVRAAGQLLDTAAYAIFNSLGYAVLAILAVTLLSLTYAFFAAPREAAPTAPS